MKRLVTLLIGIAIITGAGFYYYENVDNHYHTLQDFYDFPVPNDATLENDSVKGKHYIWEPSSGTSVPISYRFVIKKNGWKEIDQDGHLVTYEKGGQRINLALAPDYIGILKVSNQ
ncbi:hypothetical protein [Neobacillus sp. YIM B06451]|uniref:hypothetical protein n=1 Tax=Neobacillus sp. YIM B06451 TaxID=3070994 RepID=UPI00292D3CA0|nr:hypothetical protein [Neobacillus sp. YIM B06451]